VLKVKKILLVFLITLLVYLSFSFDYVFLFIADGMGIPHIQLSDMYKQYLYTDQLHILELPYYGMVETSSMNGVTDSAAAITAILSKEKTYNDRININPNDEKIFPITYELKKQGYKIGVITTNTIIDATPAGAYAFVENRRDYQKITQDLLESNFDLFIGGGKAYLKDSNTKEYGYFYTETLDRIPSLDDEIVMLYYGNFPFLTDDPNRVTLEETLNYALSKFNGSPFFILIEGGRIDHAAHAHDTYSMINEILDFDNAVKVAIDFYKQYPQDTLIIVTADHSTGGLSLGDGFLALNKFQPSAFSYEKMISTFNQSKNYEEFQEKLGLKLDLEKEFYYTKNSGKNVSYQSSVVRSFYDVLNDPVGVNWGTFGHTLDYVPLFSNVPFDKNIISNNEIFSIFEIY
jgi:alkaline phosphatase